MKFSDKQLATLRTEYIKHETMPVSILPKFRALFSKMPTEAIKQLADAQIKFVSSLAVNELVRRSVVAA